MTKLDLSILFFLQLAIILVCCRLVGWLAKFLGQPQVVAEMIAGVLMGPSLFGVLFPEWQKALFPEQSISILFAVSQVGLSLYMFIVGMDFSLDLFRSKAKTAISVSLAGMATPFVLGGALGWWLHGTGGFFPEKVRVYEAVLFMGASLCITAFPMLARIIVENGLSGTSLGTLALAAGAIDDVAAWSFLAVVLSSMDRSWSAAVYAIGGGVLYASMTLLAVRPVLRVWFTRWLAKADSQPKNVHDQVTPESNGESAKYGLPMSLLVLTLSLVMFGSYLTDKIGIYAVFGSFILGCAMPRGDFVRRLRHQIEPMTVGFLLPLFFAFSGLSTRLDLLTSISTITITITVLLISTVGKGVACWAAARVSGEENSNSIAIGALMNARGLMELILLNIGLQRGIIDEKLFSILVVMAIVTTVAATPVFSLVRSKLQLDVT